MNHVHLFQHIGGGCLLSEKENLPCDDHYKCECGAEFKAYSSQNVHFQMPQYIAGREEIEIMENKN